MKAGLGIQWSHVIKYHNYFRKGGGGGGGGGGGWGGAYKFIVIHMV